jgi:hypothetical protein
MNDTGVVMVWGLRESLLNRILTALNRMLKGCTATITVGSVVHHQPNGVVEKVMNRL